MARLTLPAVAQPEQTVETGAGQLVVPGTNLPKKEIEIDPEEIRRVIGAAREAAVRAYAPYSAFHVGAAAVMADDGAATIFSGSNVENSSYGATVCAERNALFQASAKGFRALRLLAVSTVDALDKPLPERSPCGVCRQVIREFTAKNTDQDEALILIDNGSDDVLADVVDIERLLAFGFNFRP